MILPVLADLALLVAALFAWRVSRIIAAALALAVVASLVHAATGIEALRWSSALVGLVGVYELDRFVRMHRRFPLRVVTPSGSRRAGLVEDLWRCRRNAPGALAIICLASMAGDGAAYLAWEHLAEWVQPAAQLVMSGLVIAVCVWPRRRTT